MILLMAAALAVSSDPVRVAPRGLRPASDPGSWILPNDYPKAALRANASGSTGFLLQVGPDGLVKDCLVTQSSENEGLDAAACALLGDRARFIPAIDPSGRAIASTYRSSVKWQIPVPQAPLVPLVPLSAAIEFDVAGDGRPSDCKTSGHLPTPGDTHQLAEICEGLVSSMKFELPKETAGHPASKHVVVRLDVTETDRPPAIIDTPLPRP